MHAWVVYKLHNVRTRGVGTISTRSPVIVKHNDNLKKSMKQRRFDRTTLTGRVGIVSVSGTIPQHVYIPGYPSIPAPLHPSWPETSGQTGI